ncbi:MAG: NAD-dependent epimerase/dehydratase family protein [Planctomycetes bacterium]|nr:NAD-dependent epimerase/dehydratase family protein [Planctomycetota bacterium]
MPAPTRRSFVASLAAASVAAPLAARAVPPRREAAPQKILVLGGTGFLGPHFVRAALARGHTVTLFNRGKRNPKLFGDLEQLKGDRDAGDLAALQGRTFDAVVDTSAYVPAHVTATAKLFADTAAYYQCISSISVYAGFGERPGSFGEAAPVLEVSDEVAATVTTIRQSFPHYGAMKARCEAAAEAAMPGRVGNLRPGLIVGPGDDSDRFTWWPWRIDRGGSVMAPGDPDAPVQFLDVRDLADWMLHCVEQRTVGVFNADGFAGPVSMQDLLCACKCATANPVTLTWVDEAFLADNEVGPWMQMPLWIPREARGTVDNARAIAAGLRFRPIADTVRDTLQWAKTERGGRPFERTGVPAEREAALLAKWHAAAKARAEQPAVR